MRKDQCVVFRADSSSEIGCGHIMRDLVFAEEFGNKEIVFFTRDLVGNINQEILKKGCKVETLYSNESKELLEVLKKYNPSDIIFDHYEIDWIFERELKDNINIKVTSFDDTYNKHFCDSLINHNICAEKTKYDNLVPQSCEIICGNPLVRKDIREFLINKDKEYNKTIFISMGGTDHANMISTILRSIPDEFKVIIATTSSNKHIASIEKLIENKVGVELFVDHINIALLMNECGFGIISPSVISYEAIYMELPFVSIITGEDQRGIFEYYKKYGLLTMEIFNQIKLLDLITDLNKNISYYLNKIIELKNDKFK